MLEGFILTEASEIYQSESYFQGSPMSVGLSGGGWATAWRARPNNLSEINIRTFDAGGNPTSAEITINSPTSANQELEAIKPLSDGSFAVFWYSTTGFFVRQYSADGQALSDALEIDTPNRLFGRQSVDVLSDDTFILTWDSSTGSEIFQTHFDATGTELSSAVTVSDDFLDITDPTDVIALSDGGWVVVWEGVNSDSEFGVFQRQYGADGIQ